ncbi:uncharacterized [Tachysurus ichikawai]
MLRIEQGLYSTTPSFEQTAVPVPSPGSAFASNHRSCSDSNHVPDSDSALILPRTPSLLVILPQSPSMSLILPRIPFLL